MTAIPKNLTMSMYRNIAIYRNTTAGYNRSDMMIFPTQTVIATSSGEAEYYGMVKGASQALGIAAMIHSKPSRRKPWDMRDIDGWSIGVSLGHYRCQKVIAK